MHATIIGRFSVDNDDDENRSRSTPSVAHNSPSSYISATKIPLPEDAMEDNSDHLSAMERELGSQRQYLNDICNQLIMLIALSGGVNRGIEAPPAVANAVVAPINPPNTTTHQLKPVTPSEFTGDRTKGCAFLNSCDLYIGLAPTQFANDQVGIYWVLSFMKGDRAARFTNQTMRLTQQMGLLLWVTWADFRLEFICDFCPKNEVQMARMDLETSKYHQGSHSVNEYIDKFRELVDRAEYTEGANIVLKFQHGLSPIIQNYITCLTYGRPSDDIPKDWYDAAILCNENHIANSAFQLTLQSTRTTATTGVPNPYTLFQPMRQLQLHLLDSHQGHHKTPMQWTSMRLEDKAQIQWCATDVVRLVTPDPTAWRHSMFAP